MSSDAVMSALKSIEFGQFMETQHLEKLASMSKLVWFSADEEIFREGDVEDTVYLILEGQVSVEIYVPGKGRVTVLTLGPGQLLGWSPLFAGNPNTASGRTTIRTRAIAIDAHRLRIMCQIDHELGCAIGWRIAEVIAGRLRATRLQLLDIFAPAGG